MNSSSNAQGERERLLPRSPQSQNDQSLCFTACTACANLAVERNEDDDVVSLGVKRLCFLFSIVIGFWLFSFVLIMLDFIQHERITTHAIFQFLPMWYGSAVGIISVVIVSVHVCQNATLISKERRLFMRRQGTESQSLFIDYDSLPLMRRLFCWNIGLSVTFLLVLTAQVLFAMWFIYDIIGLWHALIPVMLLSGGYLLYLYLMNFFSLWCCSFVTLAVLEMVIFTLKCNAEIPTVSWTVATIPADIVMIASYTYLAMVCYRSMYGRYHLKPAQICSLAGYLVSLTLLAAAVAITVYKEHLHGIMWNYGVSNTSDLPSTIGTLQYILCTLAVSVSTLCIIVILNMEGRALAHSRGFRNPIPLSLYKDGWMPTSGCGDVYTILLGTIEVRAASPGHIGAHIANASRLLATRSSSGHRYGGNGEHNSGHISPIDAIAAQAQRGAGAGAGLGTSNPTATVRGSGFKKGSSHQKKNSSRGDGSWEHRQLLQEWEGEIELLVRKASPLHDHSAV